MTPLAYKAGCLAAHHTLGMDKAAGTPATTTAGKGIEHLKNLIPKTTIGKGTALGGLAGVGMGTHMLMSDKRQPGTKMETPHITGYRNPLMDESRY